MRILIRSIENGYILEYGVSENAAYKPETFFPNLRSLFDFLGELVAEQHAEDVVEEKLKEPATCDVLQGLQMKSTDSIKEAYERGLRDGKLSTSD